MVIDPFWPVVLGEQGMSWFLNLLVIPNRVTHAECTVFVPLWSTPNFLSFLVLGPVDVLIKLNRFSYARGRRCRAGCRFRCH